MLTLLCSGSFGDPNARPPTPQQTPTAVFSSTLPKTPKQTPTTHFDEQASGWTPRFAEEYSVFNSTPGNLRGDHHLDFAPLSPVPVPPSTGKKRPLSTEVFAVDIAASHGNRQSTADGAPATLAHVDPTRQLLSSPEPLIPAANEDVDGGPGLGGAGRGSQAQKQKTKQQSQRSSKKSRKESTSAAVAGSSSSSKENAVPQPRTQTATPPPSSRGGRKLAPRLQIENMQSQNFGRAHFSGATAQPQQPQLNTSFVAGGGPDDVFGYAMGSASAPPITESRPFWEMDMNTTGMAIDVDLSAAGADLFHTTPSQDAQQHRSLDSIDWGQANHVFQQTGMVQHEQHQQQPPHPRLQGQERRQKSARRERPLAPKAASMPSSSFGQTPPNNQSFSFESFPMSMDDPFSTSPGGVNPGLLLGSQPVTSAGLDTGAMAMAMSISGAPPRPTSSAPANMGPDMTLPNTSIHAQQQRLSERQSNVVSPSKNGDDRPGLSGSFSESGRSCRRTVGGGRNLLPILAPAKPVKVHQPSLLPTSGNPNSRSSQPQNGRPGGRTSPLKSSHHHRLSSLTSIPEGVANFPSRSQRSASRTSVKFVIDENGRARAETVRDDNSGEDDYDAPEPLYPSFSQQDASFNSWSGSVVLPSQAVPAGSDEDGYSSSSDDEPIIIPSRNTSFRYPDPPRSLSAGNGASSRPSTTSTILSHTRVRQRSFGERYPSASSSSFRRAPPPDNAEVLEVNMMEVDHPPPRSQGSSGGRPSTGGSLGDAAAELRKVMQGVVNPRRSTSNPNPHMILGSNSSSNRQRLTPGPRSSSSTISEASLSVASPASHTDQIRCVCNRPEAEVDGVQFLVKWYVFTCFFTVRVHDFRSRLCLAQTWTPVILDFSPNTLHFLSLCARGILFTVPIVFVFHYSSNLIGNKVAFMHIQPTSSKPKPLAQGMSPSWSFRTYMP